MGERATRLPRGALLILGIALAALVNLALGLGAASGGRLLLLAVTVGLLPAVLLAFGALVESHRATLAWAALALPFLNVSWLVEPLPLPGGTTVFLTDVLLLLAVGAWLASFLTGHTESGRLRSPVFGWPLVLLGVTVSAGVVAGHERYGASLVGQPLRLVLYAGIALALTSTTAESAWRAITRIFYAGAVLQTMYAAYYIATGSSQTGTEDLSTGGIRYLALSTSIYLTGSLICALLNLELEQRSGRQLFHAGMAGLALFGIIVAFGRTTYAAVVLIVPLLLVTRRYMRRTALLILPLFAPVLVLGALLLPVVAPSVIPTLRHRLEGTSGKDVNVVWRERARAAAMEGVDEQWLRGVGFGRVSQFELNGTIVRIQGDPHNSYVYILAGGGLLALTSFLLVCGVWLGDTVRRLRRATTTVGEAVVVWSLGTWLAFMINALAGPILSDPVMLMTIWVLMSLPIAVIPLAARTRTEP